MQNIKSHLCYLLTEVTHGLRIRLIILIMRRDYLELYTDYLISSFGQATATGLSALLNGEISHDKITRFLSKEDYTSKELWHVVKKDVRNIESEDAVLIFDDTIQEKQHSKENDLICWHYDHCLNRNVKGVNLLNCIYHSQDVSLPIAFEIVKKTIGISEIKTKKTKRISPITKNEMLRNMLHTCQKNQVKWRYILADSWFSSSENMNYIKKKLKKYFIFGLKQNRLFAVSEKDKKDGRYTRVESLDWSKNTPIKGWIKGLEFPILVHRQVFINKDDSTGILYLITNDLDLSDSQIETIYKKRWKVEVFHKNIKSNTGLAKSPTHTVRTQSNHIFMSIYATAKLELLSLKHKMTSFALRSKIYLAAIKNAFKSVLELKHA